ncbi:MAG: HAMP domain-containing sensor histidine kinase [Bacteroidota bacterium]|nr:HAMP domain-containing histidine kinase [Candidatus Kapabacteria bacterium]MDW8220929.1 HAMP domain-containing sensor histidine kinase [Bacteroidota bacterium]
MHAFEAEKRFAERAQKIAHSNDIGLEDLRREYRYIAQQYSVLLNEVMKITRVSDATQTELRRIRKELFLAFQQAESQRNIAERLNEQKTEILSIAAHDLKNPIAGIVGLIELLEERFRNDKEIYQIVAIIRESAERMLSLIHNILSTSALELGKLNAEFSECHLLMVVSEVVSANIVQAEQKQQKMTFTYAPNIDFTIQGDIQLLYELCDNLISNAVKYSPIGGTITIHLDAITEHNEQGQPVEKARLRIQDNGPGLSEEDKSKLFGYFQRLSAKPTAGESSYGIGLAVAKRITELHKGNIWAESDKDKGVEGTTFFVTLPLHR